MNLRDWEEILERYIAHTLLVNGYLDDSDDIIYNEGKSNIQTIIIETLNDGEENSYDCELYFTGVYIHIIEFLNKLVEEQRICENTYDGIKFYTLHNYKLNEILD